MTLLQQLGRLTHAPSATRVPHDGVRPASRLAGAHATLWRSCGAHLHLPIPPGTPRRSSPPCVARSVPVDAATSSGAPSAALADSPPPPTTTTAAADSAPDAWPQGLPLPAAPTSPADQRPPALTAATAEDTVAAAPPDAAAAAAVAPPELTAEAARTAAAPVAAEPLGPGATPANNDPTASDEAARAATTPAAAAAAAATDPAAASEAAASRAGAEAAASTSGSPTSWPGGGNGGRGGGGALAVQPPYADALTGIYTWPRQKPLRARPAFLEAYPVPLGKTFNLNSFLGKREPHGGQYLVLEHGYRNFLASYAAALDAGYLLFLTENYHQSVYKFFLELDWDWDTDLALVMEVTPQLVALATEVASEFYSLPYANVITSIRTPYRIHLNFPQLLTTELLACLCRDRLLEACTTRLGPRYGAAVDWERLIDFPHGSLRLMGSRKAPHMDSDPVWVREKAYQPARLTADGRRWQPGRITAGLLGASSIFPQRHQVAEFERSPAYLDMIFSDLEAYQKKVEERRLDRARRREEREQQPPDASGGMPGSGSGSRGPVIPNLPPGSGKNPLYVRLEVQPDDTVALKVHIKSKFRHKDMQNFKFTRTAAVEAEAEAAGTSVQQPSALAAEAEEAADTTAAADGVAATAPTAALTAAAGAADDLAGTTEDKVAGPAAGVAEEGATRLREAGASANVPGPSGDVDAVLGAVERSEASAAEGGVAAAAGDGSSEPLMAESAMQPAAPAAALIGSLESKVAAAAAAAAAAKID